MKVTGSKFERASCRKIVAPLNSVPVIGLTEALASPIIWGSEPSSIFKYFPL